MVPSIFNSWVWVTSLIGASEALIVYGFSGGIAYAFGAGGAFFIFTLFMIHFKKKNLGHLFINDYVSTTFSYKEGKFLSILSVIILMYIIVEMAVGVGFVFNGLFGASFKMTAFFSVLIAVLFVQYAGTKLSLINDVFSFVIIVICFIYLATTILGTFDISFLKIQMQTVSQHSGDINYLMIFSKGSFRYLISAIIVGISQLLLDPTYYLKSSILKNNKSVFFSFSLGGVLMFIPITLLSSVIFGATFLSLGYNYSYSDNQSTLIATKMINEVFGGSMPIVMGIMIFLVAITTMISEFLGLLGLATTYISDVIADKNDAHRIKFGRIFTVVIGIIASLTAISLEKVSILTIDIFFGITLSAVAGTVLCRLHGYFKRNKISITVTILVGVAAGFLVWIVTTGNWYYATLSSFFSPMVVILSESLVTRILKGMLQ
jgi:Na+/proline symporter